MQLTPKQQQVLANSLSWFGDVNWVPSETAISELFDHTDKGYPIRTVEGADLVRGWTAFYSDPALQIRKWEGGEERPYFRSLATFLYDAYIQPMQWHTRQEFSRTRYARFVFWCHNSFHPIPRLLDRLIVHRLAIPVRTVTYRQLSEWEGWLSIYAEFFKMGNTPERWQRVRPAFEQVCLYRQRGR